MQLRVSRIVPGDIIRIQAGDIVPADGRLTEAMNLVTRDELLSGDLKAITKDALQPNDPSAPSEENINRVFMNTLVIHGRGAFVVTETGRNTRIGKIKMITRKG